MGQHKQRGVDMTPAEEAGIKVRETKLRLNNSRDHGSMARYEWVLTNDDGSGCPYFSTTCGEYNSVCFWLTDFDKVDNVALEITINSLDENNQMTTTTVQRTELQQQAIQTFTTMLERAEKYRATGSSDSDVFYSGYGICDNIGRCKPSGASESRMSNVKDNLIRVVPSYSGNYHYPVRHPNPPQGSTPHEAAEQAWSQWSNRWDGAYGAERIIQLKELIEHCTNNWRADDKYAYEMTPVERIGVVKDLTVVMRTTDNTLWKLHKDDGSSDPYFMQIGGNGERQSIDLRYVKVMPLEEGEKRSVSGFMSKLKKYEKQRLKLEEKARQLRVEIDKIKHEEILLDYYMAQQHGVKRISKA